MLTKYEKPLPRDKPLRIGNGLDPLANLLRELDNNILRAANVAETVAVLVALQPTDESSAAGSQAGNDGVDVLGGECDVADTRRVRRGVPVVVLHSRPVDLRQLESSVAIRSLHDRNVRPYALDPHDAVHAAIFDGPLALQHESELDEELSRGC